MSKVAELREAKGLTQSELARAIDVDVSTIRNLERNRNGLNAILRVISLCEILDCDARELIKYVEADESYQEDF